MKKTLLAFGLATSVFALSACGDNPGMTDEVKLYQQLMEILQKMNFMKN